MNEFIELRKKFYETKNPYIFPLGLLEEYISKDKVKIREENNTINKIEKLKKIDRGALLKEKELYEILLFLGEEKYLDRYIVDLVLKNHDISTRENLKNLISYIIKKEEYNDEKLYHLIDISIESNIETLDEDTIGTLLEGEKNNFNLLSILLDYIDNFNIDNFKKDIYKLLEYEYPKNLKLQILDLLIKLDGLENLKTDLIKKICKSQEDKKIYENYIDFIQKRFQLEKEGIQVLQSMFYGDFEDSGKGNNGGLAILLKGLGNEISKNKKISIVVTITISNNLHKPFISYYENKHIFIRLPIYMDEKEEDPFIGRELFIKRYIDRFLKRARLDPDIFHIRYLDNGSRAVSLLSEELNKKLVLTLTPDPHRNMFNDRGNLRKIEFNELIAKLNKIKIGDELIYRSDGILGIGNESMKKELEIYFPQLGENVINNSVKMISEGIEYKLPGSHEEIKKAMDERFLLEEIDKDFFKKPIIMNVGRLNSLKGQIELLKAWASCRLSKTYNLLIIGGDLENPNNDEKEIISFFEEYIRSNHHLKNNFYHMGAIPNEKVRVLENNIMKNKFTYPHIYLCSSKKEEFGIAILEALSQGFLAIGPMRGGVKSYINNGENGFLINTSSSESISKEVEDIIYNSNINNENFRKIQDAGKKTVDEYFSIEKISQEFLDFYLSVKGEDKYEI